MTIEEEPERLVSGYYITTSYLAALDLDEKLVGIEAKADTRELYKLAAPELPSLPNVGSLKQFNLETCVSTEPDLVILRQGAGCCCQAGRAGHSGHRCKPREREEFKETISMIGTACNVQERANELTESYDKAIADLPPSWKA
ncbi:MAG: ABC transporter substrate-binding protein [Acutalibacteraceae bacterium]